MRHLLTLTVLLLVAACASRGPRATAPTSPEAAVDQLLAADRAFAAASARTDVITGLSAMFADNVTMPVPGGRFAEGKAAAVEALRSVADNAQSRIEWAPVRGGVSADAQHGFTFGFMTLRRADGTTTPLKYLAYWVRQADGWRVVAYRRRQAAPGEPARSMMAPSLPPRLVAVTTDATVLDQHRASLEQIERDFSRDAQSIGLDAAFVRYGRSDAINMGGPNEVGFVVGAAAIGRAVGAGTPTNASPVTWGPDRAIVASSGDLGITFGMIRASAAPGAAPQPPIPFFTIWRRDSVTQPWRYIAE